MQVRAIMSRPFLIICVASVAVMLGACDKSNDNTSAGNDPTVVIVPNGDVTREGSISDEGLKKIQAKSGVANLTVAFVRSPISDAGLNQLVKFPNIRRVEASGSRITAAGIEKLKRAIPEVEVVK
jgi:hypothetical protein